MYLSSPKKNGDRGHKRSNRPVNMENRPYIHYSPSLEKIPDGEDEDIQIVAKQLTDIQRAQYNVHRHCFSGTHARTQGIVRGNFIVPNDLPKHLKQGELFAQGAEYDVVARYSTEPGDPSLDVSMHAFLRAIRILLFKPANANTRIVSLRLVVSP